MSESEPTPRSFTPRSFTPISVQVEILNYLFQNRFPDRCPGSGRYSNSFWEDALIGAVQAHLVDRGDISLDGAKADIMTAFGVLIEHWMGHSTNDFGFTSLEEIESDETLDRLEELGLVEPQ